MKSICTKLSVAMIVCTIASAILVSFINIKTVQTINTEDAREFLRLTCDNKAKELDMQLLRIEQSVELLAEHASTYMENDTIPMEERLESLEEICLSTGNYTKDAITVYFHLNPELYDRSNDFLYIRDPDRDNFYEMTEDELSALEEEGHGGSEWYFETAKARKSCWLQPRQNESFLGYENETISSYLVPVFNSRQQLIGVLGMDFTLDFLINTAEQITLYETGYAFLVDGNGKIIYHPKGEFGENLGNLNEQLDSIVKKLENGEDDNKIFKYSNNGQGKQIYFTSLKNGMRLAVTVPTKEVYATVSNMLGKTYVLLLVVIVTSVIIIFCLVYSFIRPLLMLDQATTQIIEGNMDVKINYYSKDEVGKLADNFRKMVEHLQEHIAYINQLAYRDIMTGVKNKTAYENTIMELQNRMLQGNTEFGILVFDLNNLKRVNDSLGHEAGDALIKNASVVICKAFSHSPVFRIGGDEFVVILENDDYQNYQECIAMMARLNEDINRNLPDAEKLYIAYGFSRFDSEKDHQYSDVFMRADKAMYNYKASMKQKRPES